MLERDGDGDKEMENGTIEHGHQAGLREEEGVKVKVKGEGNQRHKKINTGLDSDRLWPIKVRKINFDRVSVKKKF